MNIESITLPSHLRDLLFAVAEGWCPRPIEINQIQELSYSDLDLSKYPIRLRIAGDVLDAIVGIPDRERVGTCLESFSRDCSQGDGPFLTGMLACGIRFKGKWAELTEIGKHAFQESGTLRAVTISASMWSFCNEPGPSIWIGEIEGGGDLFPSGNLNIERRSANGIFGGATNHLRLVGSYDYYLVQHKQDNRIAWHFIVDTHGTGRPSMEVLGREFLSLEFTLGRQLYMPTLLGVEAERNTVGYTLGCARRTNIETRNKPPVPIQRDNESWIYESWVAAFFEQICVNLREREAMQQAFWGAMDMYLDAMRDHLDYDYMRLHIALEAFAYWVLKNDSVGERLDVKDVAEWEKWVKANKEAIRSHAAKGREDALYTKVKSVYRLASGKVVQSAFGELALTKEMVDELRLRDVVVHQGLMAPEGYDARRDMRRIRLIRTMLVALLARTVGYQGAINGWNLGTHGYPTAPNEWWTVADDARRGALRKFTVE